MHENIPRTAAVVAVVMSRTLPLPTFPAPLLLPDSVEVEELSPSMFASPRSPPSISNGTPPLIAQWDRGLSSLRQTK